MLNLSREISLLLCFGLTFVVALILTLLIISWSKRLRIVAQPQADRWHSNPTPVFGGVAVYLAFLFGLVVYTLWSLAWLRPDQFVRAQSIRLVWVLLVPATLMFVVGLIDDLFNIKPHTKLAWQIVAALIVSLMGVQIEIFGTPIIGIPLTVFWIVGITNAINLLDNMDGLAGGTVLVSCLSFASIAFLQGDFLIAPAAFLLAAAVLGFLLFNWKPAKIFMGDTGSMFLGHSIAVLALLGNWQSASNAIAGLLGPILILALPIFDTTLVSLNRTLSGKRVSQGGKDHSSHRLVGLGLSEMRSVTTLLCASAFLSLTTIVCFYTDMYYLLILSAVAIVLFIIFGYYLSQFNAYKEQTPFQALARYKSHSFVRTFLKYKKQIFEVLVDSVFIFAAYVLAYLIKFDSMLDAQNLALMLQSAPYVVLAKLAVLSYFDPYEFNWKNVSVYELIQLLKAVLWASLAALLCVLIVFQFAGFSRSVFVIDLMLTFLFLVGYRLFVRIADEYLFNFSLKAKKVLIVGSVGFSDVIIRYLRLARSNQYQPIGFIDNDKDLLGRKIGGVKVLGGIGDLDRILVAHSVDEVIYWSNIRSEEELESLRSACKKNKVELRRVFSLMQVVK